MGKTLYEIIKGMTIEEMAEYLCRFKCDNSSFCCKDCKDNCQLALKYFVEYLQTELEEQS